MTATGARVSSAGTAMRKRMDMTLSPWANRHPFIPLFSGRGLMPHGVRPGGARGFDAPALRMSRAKGRERPRRMPEPLSGAGSGPALLTLRCRARGLLVQLHDMERNAGLPQLLREVHLDARPLADDRFDRLERQQATVADEGGLGAEPAIQPEQDDLPAPRCSPGPGARLTTFDPRGVREGYVRVLG